MIVIGIEFTRRVVRHVDKRVVLNLGSLFRTATEKTTRARHQRHRKNCLEKMQIHSENPSY